MRGSRFTSGASPAQLNGARKTRSSGQTARSSGCAGKSSRGGRHPARSAASSSSARSSPSASSAEAERLSLIASERALQWRTAFLADASQQLAATLDCRRHARSGGPTAAAAPCRSLRRRSGGRQRPDHSARRRPHRSGPADAGAGGRGRPGRLRCQRDVRARVIRTGQAELDLNCRERDLLAVETADRCQTDADGQAWAAIWVPLAVQGRALGALGPGRLAPEPHLRR